MKFTNFFKSLLTLAMCAGSLQADDVIDINRNAEARVIPVSMSGFSGEVESVMRFDLGIAGFDFVDPSKAQYLVRGKNAGNVEGSLMDAHNKSSVFSKAYSGSSVRSQAHALANDIIFAATGRKGIAGTKIAFKVERGGSTEIFVSDYDGYNPLQMTQDKSLVSSPAWVPGQRKFYYCSWKQGPTRVFLRDVANGTSDVFARFPGANYSPAPSPDGSKVALILNKSGSLDLYVCDSNGQNLKQLTHTKDDDSSPTWSPDGKTICYVGRYATRAALYTISANGGEPKRLSVGGALNATEPDWSPDGKTIVFTRQQGSFEICTIPAQGGEAKILVTGEDPCWAGNSRTVVFSRRENGGRVLSLLDVPTKRVKDVKRISGSNCSQPSWAK